MRALSLILIIGGICWGSLSGIATERSSVPNSRALYHEMALAGTIDYAVFERAIAGYNRMGGHDKDILTVIDFTKPSTEKRLFVIDLKLKKILFISYPASWIITIVMQVVCYYFVRRSVYAKMPDEMQSI